jgi:hypothetical protein
MILIKKKCFVTLVLIPVYILFTGVFLSCGIEEHYYLEPVEQIRITRVLNTAATIILPSLTQDYATHYSIFYRIYISERLEPGEIQNSPAGLGGINPSLSSDYNIIYPYTDTSNTALNNTDIGNLFKARSYYELELEGIDIKSKLSKSGGTVNIKFPANSGEIPTLTRNSEAPVHLNRSNGEGKFEPQPDRLFLNSTSLTNNDNAKINADVASKNGIPENPRYTYVSMYIVSVGTDLKNFTPIYSMPTHISIFKLPNRDN